MPTGPIARPDAAQPRKGIRLRHVVALTACLPLVFGALVLGASVVNDGQRLPAELSAWARETGVMVCSEGKVVHGDGSLGDRFVAEGRFRCTAWRMRGVRGAQTPSAGGLVEWPTSPRR